MRRYSSGILTLIFLVVLIGLMHIGFVKIGNAESKKKILVNVDEQVLYAADNLEIVYKFDVVTGKPGKETHAGRFSVFKKFKDYTSKTYKVEMPYTMFFSKDGKAIHGTHWATVRSYLHEYITESVGSMGCVGLTEEDARTLFEWTPIGTPVIVIADTIKDDE